MIVNSNLDDCFLTTTWTPPSVILPDLHTQGHRKICTLLICICRHYQHTLQWSVCMIRATEQQEGSLPFISILVKETCLTHYALPGASTSRDHLVPSSRKERRRRKKRRHIRPSRSRLPKSREVTFILPSLVIQELEAPNRPFDQSLIIRESSLWFVRAFPASYIFRALSRLKLLRKWLLPTISQWGLNTKKFSLLPIHLVSEVMWQRIYTS